MKSKWIYKNKRVAEQEKLAKKFNVSPVILKILADRGVEGESAVSEYLNANMSIVPSGEDMTDMTKGVNIIAESVRNDKKIRIMADYDVDGVTSLYILYKGLLGLGVNPGNLSYYIPHRIYDGYGLHIPAIEKCKEDGVEVILTCDNGISADNEIALAKTYGMTVVVTDHHETPYVQKDDGTKEYIIPRADAVIDPKRPEDKEKGIYAEICGAVVAWKFMRLLYHEFGKDNEFEDSDFIEFASLGTVCDVMPLLRENRAIVKLGLEKCSSTKNIGLQALLETLGLKDCTLKSYDYGFKIGPCLNAEGRLDAAQKAFELLCETDYSRALEKAADMRELNVKRQDLTKEGMEKAFKVIEDSMSGDKVLVVYLPDTHESIAGIIAGKVRERYNKPAIVLTDSNDVLKGSGRSIEQFSMYEELVKVKDCLLGFGGHPLAAGMSLKPEMLNEFRKKLNENAKLTEEDFIPKVMIDVIMPIVFLTKDFIKQLDVLEPFGKGNEKPVFAQKHVSAISADIIGKNQNVLKFKFNNRTCKSGVCFHDIEEKERLLKTGTKMNDFSMLYYPTLNEWQGTKSVQVNISDVC